MGKGLEIVLAGLLALSAPSVVNGQQIASAQKSAEETRRQTLYQIQQLEQEARQKPTSELYEKISDLYGELKDWENALKAAKISSQLGPNRWEPYVGISTGYGNLGNFEKSLVNAVHALSLSGNSVTNCQVGWVYAKFGHYGSALNYLDAALKLSPTDPITLGIKNKVLLIVRSKQ